MKPADLEKVQDQDIRLIYSTRRTFLKMAGGMAVLFGLGGALQAFPHKPFLRPPGGQNETAFIAKCIRCDRCRSVCPTAVIGLAHLSDSVLAARTPVMEFHHGSCNFCNQCVAVCPTNALTPFDSKTVQIGLAIVQKTSCIAWNARGCTVCMTACPYDAITLDGANHPVVDPAQCNGCGVCENVCPALVLRSYSGGNIRGIKVTPFSREGDESV